MNLFSSFALLFLFIGLNSSAINIHGIYTGACKRELGTVIAVNNNSISILALDAKVKTIPRFEVIYMTQYSLPRIQLNDTATIDQPKPIQIETLKNGKIVELLSGWPIDFSKDKISFLLVDGKEGMISRNSIWNITQAKNHKIEIENSSSYEYVHPFVFRKCPKSTKKKLIYPQQTLSSPVVIKRELDRLQAGFEKIDKYKKEKRFYSTPQKFNNDTSLGIWQLFGSRYGSSSRRSNNFLPFLSSETSDGPFEYQQIITTGSGPVRYFSHSESQNHFFFGFKASYFHLNLAVDPNLILVGSNYEWIKEDLETVDFRSNDTSFFEIGFDFGHWEFQMHMANSHVAGIRNDSLFREGRFNLPKMGIAYQNHNYQIELLSGSSSEIGNTDFELPEFSYSFLRANFDFKSTGTWKLGSSLILKDVRLNDFSSKFSLKHKSQEISVKYQDIFSKRYYWGTYVAAESVDNNGGQQAQSKVFPKLGLYFSLSF